MAYQPVNPQMQDEDNQDTNSVRMASVRYTYGRDELLNFRPDGPPPEVVPSAVTRTKSPIGSRRFESDYVEAKRNASMFDNPPRVNYPEILTAKQRESIFRETPHVREREKKYGNSGFFSDSNFVPSMFNDFNGGSTKVDLSTVPFPLFYLDPRTGFAIPYYIPPRSSPYVDPYAFEMRRPSPMMEDKYHYPGGLMDPGRRYPHITPNVDNTGFRKRTAYEYDKENILPRNHPGNVRPFDSMSQSFDYSTATNTTVGLSSSDPKFLSMSTSTESDAMHSPSHIRAHLSMDDMTRKSVRPKTYLESVVSSSANHSMANDMSMNRSMSKSERNNSSMSSRHGSYRKVRKREVNPRRIAQREKQIAYGKNTEGYKQYLRMVPKNQRKPSDPRTPDKYLHCSKRGWDGTVRKWRRDLHQWDPPAMRASWIAGQAVSHRNKILGDSAYLSDTESESDDDYVSPIGASMNSTMDSLRDGMSLLHMGAHNVSNDEGGSNLSQRSSASI